MSKCAQVRCHVFSGDGCLGNLCCACTERLASLRAELAEAVGMLREEIVWLQASEDFSPIGRLNRIATLLALLARIDEKKGGQG